MIVTYIVSILIILGLLLGWIIVQHLARLFASRHPDLGPAREEGSGCSFFCFCKDKNTCPKQKLLGSFKKSKDERHPIQRS